MREKINMDPERVSFEADNLPDLVERYVQNARLRVSAATADNYDYLLSIMMEWWSGAGPTLGHVLDVEAWQLYERWLSGRPSSKGGETMTLASRQKALAVVRQFLYWAFQYGHLQRDYRHQVPSAKGGRSKRPSPRVDELRRLMAAAGESRKPERDQAIVALFLGTGIRRAELAGLDVGDVAWHAHGGGLLHIRKAKLSKPRHVAFDPVCGNYLAVYCDGMDTSGPLFCGWKGLRLTPKGVYNVVKAAMQRAGVDSRGAGPHDLRRAFATAWLRNRRSLGDGQLLSMQLGHSTEAMSVHYSRPTLDDLQNGFISPLSGL